MKALIEGLSARSTRDRSQPIPRAISYQSGFMGRRTLDRRRGSPARMSGRSCAEEASELLTAIGEDARHIASYEGAIDERASRHGVDDVVPAQGTAVPLLEPVPMDPLPVRAAPLFINKPEGGLPDGDFALPAKRQAVEAEPLVDELTRAHGNRSRGEDLEMEPGGRDGLQVPGLPEEGEDPVARMGNPEFALQDISDGRIAPAHLATGRPVRARQQAMILRRSSGDR